MRSVFLIAGAIAFAGSSVGIAPGSRQDPPDSSAAEAVVVRVCSSCHDWERIGDSRRTKAQWEDLIGDMMSRGANGSDDDYDAILSYALRRYGLVNVNKAPTAEIAMVLGLAPKEADAIVAYRKANGWSPDFESLKKVPDVDPKKLEPSRLSILYE